MGANGAIIMSFFAFVWCVLGLHRTGHWLDGRLVFPFLISATISVLAVRAARANPNAARVNDKRTDKIVMWSSMAEGMGIGLLVNVFSNIGLADRILPGVSIIVGLHFLPMAYCIPFRPFYLLAAALLSIAALGFTLTTATGALVAGLGSAVALWAASILAVRRVTAHSGSID